MTAKHSTRRHFFISEAFFQFGSEVGGGEGGGEERESPEGNKVNPPSAEYTLGLPPNGSHASCPFRLSSKFSPLKGYFRGHVRRFICGEGQRVNKSSIQVGGIGVGGLECRQLSPGRKTDGPNGSILIKY